MSVALIGTAATTAWHSFTNPATGSINLPASIISGELLAMSVLNSEPGKILTITGWTREYISTAGPAGMQMELWTRVADGTEGATVSVGVDSGSTNVAAVAARLDGADITDPTPNANNHSTGATANSANITIAASDLTGITNGNAALVVLMCEADRAVTVLDSDLSVIGEVSGAGTVLLYLDDAPGTANPQYDFTLNSAREMGYMVMEIGADSGVSLVSITDPVVDGSTGNTFSTSGFSSDITSITLKDSIGGTHSVAGILQSGSGNGPYSWDLPDTTLYTVNTLDAPVDSAYWGTVAEVTDGTDTDSISIVRNVKAGWLSVDISATPATIEGSAFYGWIGVPIQYDQVRFPYPTSDNTDPLYFYIDTDGYIYTNRTTGTVVCFYFDQSDSKLKSFDIIIGAATVSSTPNSSIGFMNSFGRLGS